MPARDRVVVLSASGFGRECLDVLEAMSANGAEIEVLGVVDDLPSGANLAYFSERGVDYLGPVDEWLSTHPSCISFVVGMGDPGIRRQIASRLEWSGMASFPAVHPTATFGVNSSIRSGVVICAGARITSKVRIGTHVRVNLNVTIGHDSVTDAFVPANPTVAISRRAAIESGVLLGTHSVVLPGLNVGSDSRGTANASVTKLVPHGVVVTGTPGRW